MTVRPWIGVLFAAAAAAFAFGTVTMTADPVTQGLAAANTVLFALGSLGFLLGD